MMHLQNETNSEWFATWFDSPFYHLLYDNRDENEADAFLESLFSKLKVSNSARILDLCCGAGRHTRAISKLGFNASGCDLSKNSIDEALSKKCDKTEFFVHDMRNALTEKYDLILNLFTSFGYFESVSDNIKVLKSVSNGLHKEGVLVIDYMNARKVILDLKRRQEIVKSGVQFNIQRTVSNGRIVKSIAFENEGTSYFFQEKVQALELDDFELLCDKAGFEIENIFGAYDLSSFDVNLSDRLILICKKRFE